MIRTGGGYLWFWWWYFGFHKIWGFLTSWKPINFSRSCVFHGVNKYLNRHCQILGKRRKVLQKVSRQYVAQPNSTEEHKYSLRRRPKKLSIRHY
jgi:hypothetical protein